MGVIMASKKKETNWSRIQQGVKDAERLITQRDYNGAMIKCRQTMEFMVKQLAARARILDQGDLKSLIEDLYINRWINKSTYEHYTTIRIVGNKAVHEGYDNAYDATQAYQLLAQEATQFSNSYSNSPKGTTPKRSDSSSSSSQRQSSSHNHSRSRRRRDESPARQIEGVSLLKLLVPILCVILLILIIVMLRPRKTTPEETVPVSTFAETTAAMPATAPAPMETAAVYRTTSSLNVRSEPSTDSDILGTLNQNAEVEYIRAINDEWALISYEGQEAYVASQYLTTD